MICHFLQVQINPHEQQRPRPVKPVKQTRFGWRGGGAGLLNRASKGFNRPVIKRPQCRGLPQFSLPGNLINRGQTRLIKTPRRAFGGIPGILVSRELTHRVGRDPWDGTGQFPRPWIYRISRLSRVFKCLRHLARPLPQGRPHSIRM